MTDPQGRQYAQYQVDAKRRSISEVFGQHVPRAVADLVISGKDSLAPIERTATVLFVDVANAYFDAVTQVMGEHNGVVTQLQGDAVLAMFNVPLVDTHARIPPARCVICTGVVRYGMYFCPH